MHKFSNIALLFSAGFFLLLMVNVTLGAMKQSVFLTDVTEMLVLFVSSVFFVAAILGKEWTRDNSSS